MLDAEILSSIAQQMMSATSVALEGQRLPVDGQAPTAFGRSRSKSTAGSTRRSSRIPKSQAAGTLASKGHQVVQFKDVETNKFVAVSVDGKVRVYGQMQRGADK